MATKRPPSSDPEDLPDPKRSKASIPISLPGTGSPIPLTPSPVSVVNIPVRKQPVCSDDGKPPSGKVQSSVKIRAKILKNKKAKLTAIKLKYECMLKEKFFLESGGNMMDFVAWKKRPNPHRDEYLKFYSIEVGSQPLAGSSLLLPGATLSASTTSVTLKPSEATVSLSVTTTSTVNIVSVCDHPTKSPQPLESHSTKSLSLDVSSAPPSATTIQIPLSTVSPGLHVTPPKGLTPVSPSRSISFPSSSPRPATRAHASFSSVYENSHEDIVMRARQEAEVMKSISELRKEGMWSASRLPKVCEPVRIKTHWDYLLEEMQWLATDFANEKRWKINAARKLSRSVAHFHKESNMQQERTEKEDMQRLRKIASSLAKEVKHFWDSIQKVVEHKHQLMLEAKRKKAMDLHLEYIVDQTAKYSDWIAKDLGQPISSSSSTRVTPGSIEDSDAFLSPPEESDDEITIDVEEKTQLQEGGVDYAKELDELQAEGEMSLEELLASLPKEILLRDQEELVVEKEEEEGNEDENVMEKAEDSSLQEQALEQAQSGADEIHTAVEDGDSSLSGTDSDGEHSDSEENGLKTLVEGKSLEEVCKTEAGLNDVAAAAEKFQPKGFTLATTEVKTDVPFLLKHKLREYQHIGLDWLVAMYERKLNGILADEMGLGKTIQTIALLAHLVCERGIWGPHLIIVPTSVLLNWEYELKKWCPALKILTYFGSLKERKQKRIGWSKRNAFHVCITSYNVAVTDHRAFRQKKWKYLILDEAQNIKNFKSQRWQTLLNFNSQCRLLLTGTPLQNNLMELWSLMHFLMPAVFSSHSDFKEWFSNPLSGMIEGSQEYNESIVKRLHQVLRPFLLRRVKSEVEKQMPKKYEHIVPCELSKRQRFLYDEFMSRAKTKDSLAGGNYLSVINVLMQLRKVCNHPDLFELRPIVSPFQMEHLELYTASLAFSAKSCDPLKHVDLNDLNLNLCNYELEMDAFASFRSRQLCTPRMLFMDYYRQQSSQADDNITEPRKSSSVRSHTFLEDLHMPSLAEKRQSWTLSRCRHLYEISSRRCRCSPVYGKDLVYAVRKMGHLPLQKSVATRDISSPGYWLWIGYANCTCHQTKQLCGEETGTALDNVIPSLLARLGMLKDMIKRFLMVIPAAVSCSVSVVCHHPHPSDLQHTVDYKRHMQSALAKCTALHHPVLVGSSFLFPERRLIQYDCGKLQTLDPLLRRLKLEGHRVLIFTQMSRMLDVLEIFLNYHGLTYLRLDGATPVQKRQYLMDRFNRDERLFCFILSTRSGGLGVNLTGADTVIFYDSDWNPTMDAQAQDRCHRIGQTRDVHIYRLVCLRTVEDNILKKANQKRMLGDIAIEGGVFTTDFFKQNSLRELFSVSSSVLAGEEENVKSPTMHIEDVSESQSSQLSEKQVEDLLLQAEDDGDAKAASKAKAEMVADKAEFDENFNSTADDKIKYGEGEDAKAMAEIAAIEDQLNGVEKYAMYFMEQENAEVTAEQLRRAEANIDLAKKDWELSHLLSLREENEEVEVEEEAEEDHLTYDRPDQHNKVFVEENGQEEMPMWLPPTPPSEECNDYYADEVLDMSYNIQTVISPSLLSSIAFYSEDDYDVFGLKRRSTDTVPVKRASKSSKQVKERPNVPASLFWKRFTADALSTKLKKLATHQKKVKSKDQFTPLLDQQPEGPEWTVDEDWILLKSITNVLEFPISLTISVPAQIPNWSIIADITSSLSRVRRSPLQCREHLMNVVIPREDGTVKVEDYTPGHEMKRQQKLKEFTSKKSRNKKEQKTRGLVVNDNHREYTKQFSSTFDLILDASISRKETPRFTWDTMQKPSMHSDLLKDYGIDMEKVLHPMSIAHQRADRIQAEHVRSTPAQPVLPSQSYHSLPSSEHVRSTPAQPLLPAQSYHSLPTSSAKAIKKQEALAKVVSSLPASTSSTGFTLPSTTSLQVGKAYNATAVGDLSKFLGITRLTSQQLMLLKQAPLHQHQHQGLTTTSQAVHSITAPSGSVQQKLSLPTGIEQLRATVASAASVLPRFTGIASSSGSAKNLTGARALRAEEILKQQMAANKAAVSQSGSATTLIQVPTSKGAEVDVAKLASIAGAIGSVAKAQIKTATQPPKHEKE